MKLSLSSTLVRRALSGHAAIGLLAGAMLYLLAISGVVIVTHEEWQRWEQPAIPEMSVLSPESVQAAAATVLASEAGKPKTTHLYIHMPNPGLPRTVVTTDHQAVYVDAEGRPAGREAHGWTEFVINLHYYLNLPTSFGMILVGGLGVMMAALSITGILAHPRIFRDAFRLRARGNRQLAHADWHNRLGVWTLPFGLAISLTGAYLGLSSIVSMSLAQVDHGGKIEKVYEPVFGTEPAKDPRPAPLPDLRQAMQVMATRFPQAVPSYVIVHDPGTQGQFVQVIAEHPRRLIFGEYYRFDGAGNFQGTNGMADGELGKQFAASTYKLHFGNFGGLPVKLAYILFGLSLAVVTGSGMSIWLMKRARRGLPSPRLSAFWSVVLWGSPTLIAGAFLLRMAGGPDVPFKAFFWGGMALTCLVAMVFPRPELSRWLRWALAATLAAVIVAHVAMLGWRPSATLWIDAALIGVALAAGLAGRARRLPGAPLQPLPAE